MDKRKKIFKSLCASVAFAGMLVLFMCVCSVQAELPFGLNGNVDISYGESNVSNSNQELLRQKYSLNWQKNYFSQFIIRSSYRFTKTDLTQNSSNPIWTKEKHPSFDVIWNNSKFTLSSGHNIRKTDAVLKTLKLQRNNWTAYFKTKSIKYPILSLRVNRDHTYNHHDLSLQDIFEKRYQIELHHSFSQSSVHYGFTLRKNENRVKNLKSTQNIHILRLSDVRRFNNNKLTLSANYALNYQSQTDERPSDTNDYYTRQILSGLYAQSNNYTLDSLHNVLSLSDRNFQEFVQPLIDIGGTNINQNIGVNFGYKQDVSAIYLSVNKYSDKRIWQVYISSDNMSWTIHAMSPDVIFDEGYNRIEILFDKVTTQYIKVITLDFSDIENVFVTEIQALEEQEISDIAKSTSSSHNMNVNTNYNYTEDINSTLDISYQHLPGQFGDKNRDNISYSLSTRYKQSKKFIHNIRWQQNYQIFNGTAQDIKDYGLNYLINYIPLEKLGFKFSSYVQIDYIADMKNRYNRSFLLNSRGTPLTDLLITVDLTYSRNNQYLSHMLFDSWNQTVSIDATVTKSLSLIFNYSHRNTKFSRTDTTGVSPTQLNRNQYLISFRYRLSKTIFMRGSMNLNKSDGSYFSQDYMISWSPSRKLSISSQMRMQDDNDIKITKRYNTQMNYKVSRNANLYLSYFINDLTKANGDRNKSIRVGFRSGL